MKKIISMCLVLSLVFSLSVSAFAVNVDADAQVSDDVVDAVNIVLSTMAGEKEDYGFDADVDFMKLQIGNEVPAYQVENTSLNEIKDMDFYPIIDEYGDVVAIAKIIIDNRILAFVDPTMSFNLNDIHEESQISIIFDDIGSYCWDGTSAKLLGESGLFDVPENTLDSIPSSAYARMDTSSITVAQNLDSSSNSAMPAGYDDEVAYMEVSKVKKPSGSMWCWAACMASVVNTLKSGNYTCEKMANIYTTNQQQGATSGQIRSRFLSNFGLRYSEIIPGVTVIRGDMVGYIGNKKPVFAVFIPDNVTNPIAHSTILRGFNNLNNTFSIMDPDVGKYVTGQIGFKGQKPDPIWGRLMYVQPNGSQEMKICEYMYLT